MSAVCLFVVATSLVFQCCLAAVDPKVTGQPFYLADVYWHYPRETGNFTYSSFAPHSVKNMSLFGSAVLGNRTFTNDASEHFLQLTNGETNNQVGSAVHDYLVSIKYGFESQFKVRLRKPHGRTTDADILDVGDGFVFLIASTPLNRTVMPTPRGAGSHLGYHSMQNALAIEFDFYMNEEHLDPNDAHVSVKFRGSEALTVDHRSGFGAPQPPSFGAIAQYPPDDRTAFLLSQNKSSLNGTLLHEKEVLDAQLNQYIYTDAASPVNFIFPNVTPHYNWASISHLLDGEEHQVRIVYDAATVQISIFIDDMETPLHTVYANLSKLVLQEAYMCKHYNGCYTLLSYGVDPDTKSTMDKPICEIRDYYQSKPSVLLFRSNVTSSRSGGPYLYNTLFGPTNCEECRGYEGCGAYVGLMASTGSKPMIVEFFEWSLTSAKPSYKTVEFEQKVVPKRRMV